MTDLEPAVNSTDALIYAGTDVDADSSDLVNLARAQRIADVWNEEKTILIWEDASFYVGLQTSE